MSDSIILWTRKELVAEIVAALNREVGNQEANGGNNMLGWDLAREFIEREFSPENDRRRSEGK